MSANKCSYKPQSFAAREVGCPLDHCECGTHDVEQKDHTCPSNEESDLCCERRCPGCSAPECECPHEEEEDYPPDYPECWK